MISVRKGVFETNSSSVHTIVIQKDPPKNIYPIKIQEDDYGWNYRMLNTPEERASYFFTALSFLGNSLNEPTKDPRMTMMSLLPKDIRYDCEFKEDDCYIDHCDELQSWVQDLIKDNDKFLRFIYGDKSYVETGNDNVDQYGKPWFDDDDDDDDDEEWTNPFMDKDGSEVFIKGN